ncbi:MAG: EAL domain-containing protein [Sulfurospirillaceae bacterium]|nr:EAL domain-containing protein [Sulfurospirillaceae bacterium]MDD2827295.1 EAL domain-containing protein [Sulfurospirillaceae bacterium]
MPYDNTEELRTKIIGLGETSVRKSYYPQLQDRILELERFHTLLDRSREMIILVEAEDGNCIVDCNAIVPTILGVPREAILNTEVVRWLPFEVVEIMTILKTQGEVKECCLVETIMPSPMGTFPVEFILQCASCSDKNYFIVMGSNISERKNAESKIYTLAFYDSLTQLPNRQLLNDRIIQALAKSQRHRKYGAILFVDLDNFKTLNDTKGHHIGDMLLVEVAQRVEEILRDGDTLGRLGGDEFIVLLEGLSYTMEVAAVEAKNFAQRIKETINRPYNLSGYAHTCSSSIGVTLFLGTEQTKDSLLKYADIAMYQAKQSGRNTICFYDPAMQEAIQLKMTMENELRSAILYNQLILFYQPQVDLSGIIVGLEALVRWNHPIKGLIAPNDFIPLAEETGLIISLGQWVLEEACRQIKIWEDRFSSHIKVSVNVSVKQFQEGSFYTMIADALYHSGVSGNLLKIELTESIIVDNILENIEKIKAIRSFGIGFSLDDFGTGYSSLSYLKRLPLDELKIDQSFIRDITMNSNDAMLVQTIIDVAHNFDLQVIAEGVENEEQLSFLKAFGCKIFQGYLFGKPIPVEEIERLLIHTL